MFTNRLSRSLAKVLPLVAVLGLPNHAEACGGLFCSGTQTPIDQKAEHILFTINGDHTVTAYVQITYAGDPSTFAWIVPAPSAPRLSADFPDVAMRALDVTTQPQYTRACFGGPSSPVGGVGGSGGSGGSGGGGGGVTVISRENVGPFETVTLEGTSAEVLVEWLQENGYRITDKMIPFIQPYVEGGMKFLAMRLQQGKDTSDIRPIVMTYDSDKPAIPLRLTTVAAQPEMGIVTYVLANKRWAPDNYVDLKIADSLIQFGPNGSQNNYLTVVSREADKVGGQAFVTEYADATSALATQIQNIFLPSSEAPAARSKLVELFNRFPYITRLYTRMSAEEMTEDPTFKVATDQAAVSRFHNLNPLNICGAPPPVDTCAFTYCGRQGVCTPALVDNQGTLSWMPACVCKSDSTARSTDTGGTTQPQAYCEPEKMNLDSAPAGTGGSAAALLVPACEGFNCGAHGHCVGMNGSPTCKCDSGYGAVSRLTLDPNTGQPTKSITCEAVGIFIPPFPVLPPVGQPGAGGTTSTGGTSGVGGGGPFGCSVVPLSQSNTAAVAAAFAGIWAAARELSRRRRSKR